MINLNVLFILQVSYASKDLKADVIIDLATLTGAQGLATGCYIFNFLSLARREN